MILLINTALPKNESKLDAPIEFLWKLETPVYHINKRVNMFFSQFFEIMVEDVSKNTYKWKLGDSLGNTLIYLILFLL